MTKHKTVGALLGPIGPFYRSVALDRDLEDKQAAHSFVLTPWLKRGVSEIISGLRPGSTRRAWRVIGDFGVGKSALALALIQALERRPRSAATPMRRLIDELGGAPRMFPLVVVGSSAGFATSMERAVSAALDRLRPSAQVARAVLKCDPFDAVCALRDAARATGRYDGLILVIDEMGKFLEAAGLGDASDVFRLQELAEGATRSNKAPLAVLLLLHKGFQSYAEDWKASRRSEWQKIAERFDELVYDHPLSHTAALLAAALGVDEDKISAAARKAHKEASRAIRALGWHGPRLGGLPEGCWPLHPGVVPVLSRFFARFGQNERSLFGFAASEEPSSLRAFAANTQAGDDLYSIHDFFDYVASSFGYRLTSRAGAGDWDRIGAVLERSADADPVEIAVLKTVGILNLVDAPDLQATRESLAACLGPAYQSRQVAASIDRLRRSGLLFNRPGRPDFRLWTSRRVDLSALWSAAEREVEARPVLEDLPRHLCTLPPRVDVLARKHSIATGTSRRFAVRCLTVGSLAGWRPPVDADGSLVGVFCRDEEDLRIARAWAAEGTAARPALLVVIVPPTPDLGLSMVELLRHRWVAGQTATLGEDAFAAAEIERGIADIEARLGAAMSGTLGLMGHGPNRAVELFADGIGRAMVEPAHAAISRVCDAAYPSAPLVENELVNRHTLTSAGAGARQRLIEAMFLHASDPGLGFPETKNPPEKALYLSFLRRGLVHHERGSGWTVGPPDIRDDPLRLRPALDAVERLLAEDPGRVPVAKLYETLAARPFGVRRGLSPLLLAVVLAAARHRVALFERGTYCTRLDGATFMRILKSPENFELQWVSLEGVRADVFRKLATLLDKSPSDGGLMAVVDPLVRFAADLPVHVRHSMAIDQTARAVRKALLEARSPVDLIFRDLPVACGCEPFESSASGGPGRAAAFVRQLEAAIAEIRGCYPLLLEGLRRQTLQALEASCRADIAARAAPLAFRLAEQQLRTFALRLADEKLAEDPWAEALGGALVGKPPSRWLDADVAVWRSGLDELAARFVRVEAAAFGNEGPDRNAVRISLTRTDGRERAVVVGLADVSDDEMVVVRAAARMAEDAGVTMDRMVALLSLQSMAGSERSDGASETAKEEAR